MRMDEETDSTNSRRPVMLNTKALSASYLQQHLYNHETAP